MKIRFMFAVCLTITLLVACQSATPMPTREPTAEPLTNTPEPSNTPLPTSTPMPTLTPTITPITIPTLTPWPTSTTPTLTPNPSFLSFAIGDVPFRFVGAFIPGWFWGHEYWSEEVADDLIASAKARGITVLHLMPPQFEQELGVYKEDELVRLDHFLVTASKHGVYVMPAFIHGYSIAVQPEDPYYHPAGIEGLIADERLAQAFRNRIEVLVNRRNTINERLYREDPTILAWIVIEEPVSAPWNYPERPPQVTVPQLNAWFEETASFVKSLDPNHLITVLTTAAIDTLGEDWLLALDVPSIDFVYAEDAELRILPFFNDMNAESYSLRLFTLKKPVVMMLSFTSGVWDQQEICRDYPWQAEMIGKALSKYFEAGASGVVVFSWGSDLYASVPSFDECFVYTATNEPVSRALQGIAIQLNVPGYPSPPLQFVSIHP